MKNKLSILAISFFTFRASFIGITSHLLINESKQNAWLSLLISGIISIPIILLFYLIAQSNKYNNIIDKINNDYTTFGRMINYLFGTFIFIFTIINFYNLTDLVATQYLYKTPKIIISLILILPIYYLSKTGNESFKITVLILFYFSIILYLISIVGLIHKVNLSNVLPIDFKSINTSSYPLYFNTIPLFILLVLPNDEINKNYIYGYILAFISIFIMFFIFISILGIDLLTLFKYPEFFILKLAFDGVINIRLQNILGIQFILDIIIFISLGLKYSYKSFNTNKSFLFILITFITAYLLNIYYIKIYDIIINYLQYIMFIFFVMIVLIKKEKKLSLKNN